MKTLLTALSALLLFSASALGGEKYGEPPSLPALTKVSAIYESPGEYVGKDVKVEGMIIGVCERRGCWMELAGDREFEKIRIKVDDGVMVCLDPATGERCWKGGRYGHGQILLVGELLLVQTEHGDLVLIEPNPEELIELARYPVIDGKTWNVHTLAGRYLLMRNEREAVMLEMPLEGET